jgi:transglutaminase-like putative cysteine protease
MSSGRMRSFEFEYKVGVAPEQTPARLWLPLPSSDLFQDVVEQSLELGGSVRAEVNACDDNRVLYLRLPTLSERQTIRLAFRVTRRSRSSTPPSYDDYGTSLDALGLSSFVSGNARVPIDGQFGDEALDIVARATSPFAKARAVFDHVLATYSYDSSGCTPAKGDAVGDLQVACDIKLGTCTDLHGVLIAYLRAAGVPARFAFGFNVPVRPRGPIAGYHCWSEVYLPGSGWFPIDVSEARKREAGPERDFYFGNLDENRVQFSTGRDLNLAPPQASGPLDKLIFPLVEQQDRVISPQLEFSFCEVEAPPRREHVVMTSSVAT